MGWIDAFFPADADAICPACPVTENASWTDKTVAAVGVSSLSSLSSTKNITLQSFSAWGQLWKCYPVCGKFSYNAQYTAGKCAMDGGKVEILQSCKYGFIRERQSRSGGCAELPLEA